MTLNTGGGGATEDFTDDGIGCIGGGIPLNEGGGTPDALTTED